MDKLKEYKALVQRYHRTLDLMSERAVAELDTKIGEARVYAELIEPRFSLSDRILDLGSGVGLPGIVLASAFPNHDVALVERRQRRANFLKICVGKLGLTNITIVAEDVRTVQDRPYTWICAQAVGQFRLLYCLTRHLHAPTVTVVSRRSEVSPAEQAELEAVSGPVLETVTAPLPTHGKVVAVRLQGGRPCPSSG